MKIVINAKDFSRLGRIAGEFSAKSSIYTNMLIEAGNNQIYAFVGDPYDRGSYVQMILDCEVKQGGFAAVNAHDFNRIAKSAINDKAENVTILQIGNKASFKFNKSTISTPSEQNKEDFTLPKNNISDFVTVRGSALIDGIKAVEFAASTSDSRPILQGIRVTFNERRADFIAANGYLLASIFIGGAVERNDGNKIQFVLPSESLVKIVEYMNDNDKINVSVSGNIVTFFWGDYRFDVLRMNGEYPDIDALVGISGKYVSVVTVNSNDFLRAIKLANIFSIDTGYASYIKNPDINTLSVHSRSPRGNTTNTVACNLENAPIDICLNSFYLTDIMERVRLFYERATITTNDGNLVQIAPQHDIEGIIYRIMIAKMTDKGNQ